MVHTIKNADGERIVGLYCVRSKVDNTNLYLSIWLLLKVEINSMTIFEEEDGRVIGIPTDVFQLVWVKRHGVLVSPFP